MLALDLFAGAGGWDVACKELDIASIGVEIDKDCIATREAAGLSTIQWDVRDIGLDTWYETWGYGAGPIDILIASPPCQDFSHAGKRKGLDSERGRLVYEVQRFYRVLHPTYIACEQVPAVLPIWEELGEDLKSLGYEVWTGILHAEQYGVPQTRKRAIMLGRRDGRTIGPPRPTHSRYYSHRPDKLDEGLLRWITMSDALGWSSESLATHTTFKDEMHIRESENPSQTISEHLRDGLVLDTRRDRRGNADPDYSQTRTVDAPVPSITTKSGGQFHIRTRNWMQEQGGNIFTDDRPSNSLATTARSWLIEPRDDSLPRSRPAPTVSAGGTSTGGPEVFANAEARKRIGRQITIEEASVLQTFPRDYPWQGSKTSKFRQIGNACPPLLAYHILRELIS